MTRSLGLKPDQIAVLVADIEASAGRYARIFGVNEWRLWTYGPDFVPHMTYRDEPGRFVMRLALSDTTPQLELVEPVAGPSIYEEWMATHGYGLHHIGTFVPSLDSAIDTMRAAGFELIQSGRGYGADGDGGFAFFDTVDDLGVITEVLEIPTQRRPPEATWREGCWYRPDRQLDPAPAEAVNR